MLKNKVFSAVRWTTASAVIRGILQFIQIAILARILPPEDYGLIAIVSVVLSFTGLLADLGLNSAYTQARNVTPEQRSSLFWANFLMSIFLFMVISGISSPLADFFDDKRLVTLIILSSSIFIINALGQQLRINAEKELNFRPVIIIDISAVTIGFLVAVLTALAGMGVYALVWGSLSTALASTVFSWAILSQGWRPKTSLRIVDIKPFINFGSTVVGNNIINQINMNMDLLLGGHIIGTTQLGLFSLPRTMILQIQFLINPVITRVGFPLIAQIQNDIPRVREVYLKTLNMTASTNAPIYIGIAFFAPEFTIALFGDNWKESSELIRILAIWGFLRSICNPVGSLLMGLGKTGLSLKWNSGLLLITPPIMWIGSQHGAVGVSYALLGLITLIFIPMWHILIKPVCDAGIKEYTATIAKPTTIAIIASLTSYILVLSIDHSILRLFIGINIEILTYLILSIKLNKEWSHQMYTLVFPPAHNILLNIKNSIHS